MTDTSTKGLEQQNDIILSFVDEVTGPIQTVINSVTQLKQSFSTIGSVGFSDVSEEVSFIKTQIDSVSKKPNVVEMDALTHNAGIKVRNFNSLVSEATQPKTITIDANTVGMAKVAEGARKTQSEIDKAAKEQAKLNAEIEKGAAGFMAMAKRVAGVAVALVGVHSIGQSISSFLDYSVGMTRSRSRIAQYSQWYADEGKSGYTNKEVERMIMDASMRSYADVEMMMKATGDIMSAGKHKFSDMDEVIRFSESLNKMFITANIDDQVRGSIMYNLGQSFRSGRLTTQDLNIIQSNMAEMFEYTEKYMGWEPGTMKEKSEAMGGLPIEDLIASIIAYSDDIDEKFRGMDLTLADYVTNLKNTFQMEALMPMQEDLKDFLATEEFKEFFDGVTESVRGLGRIITPTVSIFVKGFNVIYDNWKWLKPLFLGAAAGLTVFTVGVSAYTIAATAASVATLGWVWPLAVVAGVAGVAVVALYALTSGVNEFTGTTISATGILASGIGQNLAAVQTTIAYTINAFQMYSEFWDNFWENPTYATYKFLDNALNNLTNLVSSWSMVDIAEYIFPDYADSLSKFSDTFYDSVEFWRNSLMSFVNTVIDGVNTVKGLSNTVLGTDFEKTVRITSDYVPEDYKSRQYVGYFGHADLYKMGAGLEGMALEVTNPEIDSLSTLSKISNKEEIGELTDVVKGIAGDTNLIANADNYDYLREYAIRNTITQNAPVSIVLNVDTNVRSESDIKKLVESLKKMLEQELVTTSAINVKDVLPI